MPMSPMPQQPTQAPMAPAGAAAPQEAPQAGGLRGRGMLQIVVARKMLEMALEALGSGSDEGRDVVKALSALSKISADTAPGLMQSEYQALQGAVNPNPGAMPTPRPVNAPQAQPGMMPAGMM